MHFIDIQNDVIEAGRGFPINNDNYHMRYVILHNKASSLAESMFSDDFFFYNLADLSVQLLGWLGSTGFTCADWNEVILDYNDDDSQPWSSGCQSSVEFCAEVHSTISASYMSYVDIEACRSFLAALVICSFCFALENNRDLESLIADKIGEQQ